MLNNKKVQYESKICSIKPKLDVNRLTSILNSSEYLGMQNLVYECMKYAVQNIVEISNLPHSLTNFSGESIKQMA